MNLPRAVRISAILVAGLVVLAMLAWIGVGIASTAGVATPEYTVVSRHDGYEIRDYAPQIVAQVQVEGDFESGLNRGFRALADYIFGNNTVPGDAGSGTIAMTAPVLEQVPESSSIAMTAPVLEEEAAGTTRKVSFVMPREYTMESIPKPNNPEVKLIEMPPSRYAALPFSGWVDTTKSATMKARLREYLARDNQASIGVPLLAQYDPPWTPPFMRRNEILVPLPLP